MQGVEAFCEGHRRGDPQSAMSIPSVPTDWADLPLPERECRLDQRAVGLVSLTLLDPWAGYLTLNSASKKRDLLCEHDDVCI